MIERKNERQQSQKGGQKERENEIRESDRQRRDRTTDKEIKRRGEVGGGSTGSCLLFLFRGFLYRSAFEASLVSH